MIAPRRKLCISVLLALALGPVPAALAQSYPTKPVTLVMP